MSVGECVICGAEVRDRRAVCCSSPECRKARRKSIKNAWKRDHPEVISAERKARAHRKAVLKRAARAQAVAAAAKLQKRPEMTGIDCYSQDCATCPLSERGVCVDLVVASCGPLTLDEIGTIFGLTSERIRQIEAEAVEKIRKRAPAAYRELIEAGAPEPGARPWRLERWRVSDLKPELHDRPMKGNPNLRRSEP